MTWGISVVDALGYAGSALTVATFYCRDVRCMRPIAVSANVAMLGYGLVGALAPVVALHAVLLPINLWRWRECVSRPPLAVPRRTCHGSAAASVPVTRAYPKT